LVNAGRFDAIRGKGWKHQAQWLDFVPIQRVTYFYSAYRKEIGIFLLNEKLKKMAAC